MTDAANDDRGPQEKRRRLFFALWPPAELQTAFWREGRLALGAARGRRIGAERLHLTLAFLGSVAGETQRCYERAAAEVRGEVFDLVLERTGCFRRNGILWLGPLAVPPPLLELVHSLNTALSTCGFVPESRPYRAHVTLARDVQRCPEERAIEPIVWKVGEFSLVESRTDSSGAHYERLTSWGLATRL
jgi:RNA 2',3'-cyclic 3'-phosphodiesterase